MLKWFEPAFGGLTKEELIWLDDWNAFVEESKTNVGLYDPTGEAKNSLTNLHMKDNQCIMDYIVQFNYLAVHCQWGDSTLHPPVCHPTSRIDLTTAEFQAAIAVLALEKVLEQAKSRAAIVGVIPDIVALAVLALEKVLEQAKSRAAIVGVIPDIVALAVLALEKVLEKAEFRAAIVDVIPDIVALLKHSE
ncbi:hypothetical protein BU17DRAFT_86599 [Hysterangium stoloniferum]|nr:hypothetical protein BU17DRAFT_86599 [Hysterangium stoloniferum]